MKKYYMIFIHSPSFWRRSLVWEAFVTLTVRLWHSRICVLLALSLTFPVLPNAEPPSMEARSSHGHLGNRATVPPPRPHVVPPQRSSATFRATRRPGGLRFTGPCDASSVIRKTIAASGWHVRRRGRCC